MNMLERLPQLALLDRVVSALADDQRARAALLRSPLPAEGADVYSPLDLLVVADVPDDDALLALGHAIFGRAGQALWVSVADVHPPRLRALYPGPLRLDLAVGTAATLAPNGDERVLLDKDGLLPARAARPPDRQPLLASHVLWACDEFWWTMFGSVGQLKRGQLWLALSMLDTCRTLLAQVMRWRRDATRPSERFADLERHLTAEDQQALAQTLAGYDLRGIAEALLCAADAFDPAARDVAARVGAEYPAALAHETKSFFIREFWSLLAPGPALSA